MSIHNTIHVIIMIPYSRLENLVVWRIDRPTIACYHKLIMLINTMERILCQKCNFSFQFYLQQAEDKSTVTIYIVFIVLPSFNGQYLVFSLTVSSQPTATRPHSAVSIQLSVQWSACSVQFDRQHFSFQFLLLILLMPVDANPPNLIPDKFSGYTVFSKIQVVKLFIITL